MKKALQEKDKESREIHKYMQNILNEKIDAANKVITEITDDNYKGVKNINKNTNKNTNKRTKKKKRKKSSKKKK